MAKIGQHAVVLGASMGGLVAARVLADFYDSVTVVERDVLPVGAANRRGVPQGRHVHALLGRGGLVLAEMFPGITAELTASGAPSLDYTDVSEAYFCVNGHPGVREGSYKTVPTVLMPSRPLLESRVRERLRDASNITLLEGYDVEALMSSPSAEAVTGVRIRGRGADGESALRADLVVDATGRGSHTPAHLEAMGYGRPREDTLRVGLTYCSQMLRIPAGTMHEKVVIVSPVPDRTTGMALCGYEDDTWIFTAFGMAGSEPPRELSEMLRFVAGFAPAHVVEAMAAAEPLGDVIRTRYPESRWRRYDKMRRFPDGLLVLGDAFCSFNPIYGQGMTVAALQAQTLAQCLAKGSADLARRYFRKAAKPIAVAWQFAVGADLNLPGVEGRKPLALRLTNRYVERLQSITDHDIVVAEQFIKVVGLVDPPARLMHPKIALRVLFARPRAATSAVDPATEAPIAAA